MIYLSNIYLSARKKLKNRWKNSSELTSRTCSRAYICNWQTTVKTENHSKNKQNPKNRSKKGDQTAKLETINPPPENHYYTLLDFVSPLLNAPYISRLKITMKISFERLHLHTTDVSTPLFHHPFSISLALFTNQLFKNRRHAPS